MEKMTTFCSKMFIKNTTDLLVVLAGEGAVFWIHWQVHAGKKSGLDEDKVEYRILKFLFSYNGSVLKMLAKLNKKFVRSIRNLYLFHKTFLSFLEI